MHIESQPSGQSASGLRIALVVSRYHNSITKRLADGATRAFREAGGPERNLLVTETEGSFELPVVAAALADREEVDAVVALGCIIAGETNHDQVIAHAVAHGLMHLSLESRKPMTFGILTCATLAQAEERAGGSRGNKGADAMRAAIDACNVIENLQSRRLKRDRT